MGQALEHSQPVEFVADGWERAWKAMEPDIRREVKEEFAEEWNASGLVRRWFLLRKIDAEVERRLAERAPSDALY